MLTDDHAATALAFLDASDREFAAGDQLQASEKLWGAATHALMAMAMQGGRRLGSHNSFRDTAEQLSDEYNDASIEYGFAHAERFHRNFYHADIGDYELDALRRRVHDFVHRVLSLLG